MQQGTGRRPIVAGNWKMNGLRAAACEVDALVQRIGDAGGVGCEVLICPPATLLMSFADIYGGRGIQWGAQDCHSKEQGAHTGDISAEMLRDAGAVAVILGHSERRRDHGETDALVRAKAQAAHRAGLTAIVCVGETEEERDSGRTLDVVGRQVRDSLPENSSAESVVVAYEPVWAIGTGRTPTNDQIQEVHASIRRVLAERHATGNAMRILYGGSVKPSNAREIFALPDVDGGLIGGASLKADDLWGIIEACAF